MLWGLKHQIECAVEWRESFPAEFYAYRMVYDELMSTKSELHEARIRMRGTFQSGQSAGMDLSHVSS